MSFFKSLVLLATAGLIFAAGCANLAGPKVITLSQAELTGMLDKRFPFNRRLMEVVDVRVATPRLRLLPETNRLATEFDVNIAERLFGRTLNGRIAADYALRYDAAQQAVLLSDVRVGKLDVVGASGAVHSALQSLGPLLAEQMLEGTAIYKFKPEDLTKAQGRGYEPSAVTVTSRGVEITLAPLP